MFGHFSGVIRRSHLIALIPQSMPRSSPCHSTCHVPACSETVFRPHSNAAVWAKLSLPVPKHASPADASDSRSPEEEVQGEEEGGGHVPIAICSSDGGFYGSHVCDDCARHRAHDKRRTTLH